VLALFAARDIKSRASLPEVSASNEFAGQGKMDGVEDVVATGDAETRSGETDTSGLLT